MMGNPGAPTRAVGGAADGTVKSVACVALAVLCVLVVASASLGREGAGASRLARRYSPESYSAVKPASAVLGAERAELGFTAYEPARAEELLFDDDASARLSTAVLLSGGAWSSAEPEAYDAGEEAGAFPDAPSGAGAGAGTVGAPPPPSASASAADAAGESLGELEGFSEEEGEGEGEGAEAEAGDSSAQAGGSDVRLFEDLHLDDPRLLELDRWPEVPERYRLRPEEEGVRYFLYQPSGGWGNQRLILRWAILAANAMNRTLVVPPVAPHTNFFDNYNAFGAQQMVHMGMVLDLDSLAQVVQAGIRVHAGDMASYRRLLPALSWRVWERPEAVSFLAEKTIKARWARENAQVVFWSKGSMWKCCQTHEQRYYWFLGYGIVANRFVQSAVSRAVAPLGNFSAVHFRRGDSFPRERASVEKYARYHGRLARFVKSDPLFVATDETELAMFKAFQFPSTQRRLNNRLGFHKVVFQKDLDAAHLQPLLDRVPDDMRGMIRALVDMIVCEYAHTWAGSSRSTFSFAISSNRNKKRIVGQRNLTAAEFLPR
jgi:hypothetical protein